MAYNIKRKRISFSFDTVEEDNEKEFERFLINAADYFYRQLDHPLFNYECNVKYEDEKDEDFKKCKDKLLICSLNDFRGLEDKTYDNDILSDIIKGKKDPSCNIYYLHKYELTRSNYINSSRDDNSYSGLCDYQSCRSYSILPSGSNNAKLINLKEEGKLVCNVSENDYNINYKLDFLLRIFQSILNTEIGIFTCKIKKVGDNSYAVKPIKMINPFRFICNNIKFLSYKSIFKLNKYLMDGGTYLMSEIISKDLFNQNDEFKWYEKFCKILSNNIKNGISDEIKSIMDYANNTKFDKPIEKKMYVARYLEYLHFAICNYKALYLHENDSLFLSSYSKSFFKRMFQTKEECINFINDIKSSFTQFPNSSILSYLFYISTCDLDASLISDNTPITRYNEKDKECFDDWFRRNRLILDTGIQPTEIYKKQNITYNTICEVFMNTKDKYEEKIDWVEYYQLEELSFNSWQRYLLDDYGYNMMTRSDEELLVSTGILSKKFLPELKEPSEYTNKEMIRTWLVQTLLLPNKCAYYTGERYYESSILYTLSFIFERLFLNTNNDLNMTIIYDDNRDIFEECIRLYGINSIGFSMLRNLCLWFSKKSININDINASELPSYEGNEDQYPNIKVMDDFLDLYMDIIERCPYFISQKSFINFVSTIRDIRTGNDVRMRIIKDQGRYKKLNKIILDESIKQNKLNWRV